jgi:hypothetical protein
VYDVLTSSSKGKERKQAKEEEDTSDGMEAEARQLLEEARKLGIKPGITTEDQEDDDDDEKEGEEDTQFNEQHILSQAQDEARLSPPLPPPRPPRQSRQTTPAPANDDDPLSARLSSLLSPPTTLPFVPPPAPAPVEADTIDPSFARLLSLNPSTAVPLAAKRSFPPTTKPTPKPFSLPGWQADRDDSVDSWCCPSSPSHVPHIRIILSLSDPSPRLVRRTSCSLYRYLLKRRDPSL